MLKLAIRQVQKAASFQEASDDLRELADVPISDTHLRRLGLRIGQEWKALQDAEAQAFKDGRLGAGCEQPAKVAAVMVDGGRVQTRAEDSGRGVSDPRWRESKVACCQSMSCQVHAADPQPEPPAKFLDQVEVARVAAEVKSRGRGGAGRPQAKKEGPPQKRRKRRREADGKRPVRLVRTVLASMASSEEFGWRVAAEVRRRGLDKAQRKAYVCDGLKYNWSIHEMHLLPWGFIPILDFLHLLAYLYCAAQAGHGKGTQQAWEAYERWLRWGWAGQVQELLKDMRACGARLGEPPEKCPDDDPRKVVADAVGYVSNNRSRMDYPRYRRLGLPVSSAWVESTIKQINRRVKGSEKFWQQGGAEALLQLRAAHLSQDGRAQRYWDSPRPYSRAASDRSLRPAS